MSGERTDPPTLDDEPLGTTEPTWRDEQRTAEAPDSPDDDAERTIDADPAWLAQLAGDDDPDVATTGDAERTIDVDADLLEHVRAATRAARDGLAAPPTTAATDDEPGPPATEPEPPPAAERPTAKAVDPWLPPPPGGATSWLLPSTEPGTVAPPTVAPPTVVPPATVAAPPPPENTPVAPTGTATTAGPAVTPGGGRWQPPARLRPAEVRPAVPLLAAQAPKRRHLDWRWAAVAIVLAAAVGFLIAIAVSGDDSPDPVPGSTTVPGASTTVSTP